MRAFVALAPPPAVRARLSDLRDRLAMACPAGAVRWVKDHQLHLTLVFLNEISAAQAEAVSSGLAEIARAWPPLGLGVRGLGMFPDAKRLRVVWAGVGGDVAGLGGLQAAVSAMCAAAAGYVPEHRDYHPHFTLGRVRDEVDGIVRGMIGATVRLGSPVNGPTWVQTTITLYRSELKPGGAEHSVVWQGDFTGPG